MAMPDQLTRLLRLAVPMALVVVPHLLRLPVWIGVIWAACLLARLQQARRDARPLGRGLRISAGRPDRGTVQTPGRSPRILGRIEQIDWQVFPPQPPAPAESLPPPADR